jgi:hypothetical protein
MSPRVASHPTFPSVTEILESCGLSNGYAFLGERRETYLAMGKARHLAIQYHAEGTLDYASLHPDIKAQFDSYLALVETRRWVAIASEVELVHPYGFVGRLDAVGLMDDEVSIVDWKGGNADLKAAKLQLAGYGLLWNYNHPEQPAVKRYAVPLVKNGVAKPVDVTDAYSEQIFLAAVIVHRAKEEK